MKKLLNVAKVDDLHDLIAWMADHQTDDDWPLMTEDAVQWLCDLSCNLGPARYEIADKHVEAIEFGIADWCEVLSNYEDSEHFETCVEEAAE